MKINLVDNEGKPITFNIAGLLAVLFIIVFSCITYGAFQLKEPDLFKTLSQGLLNILIAIASYYFGSSSGSRAKDDTIATALGSAGKDDKTL